LRKKMAAASRQEEAVVSEGVVVSLEYERHSVVAGI
jgi:hypothetical protein